MTAYIKDPLDASPALDQNDINSNFNWTFDAHVTGWIDAVNPSTGAADTWTYASASSFTISGVDRTSVFTAGTKIKLTQTSAKYFIVLSSTFSTDTTVNVDGRGVYTVANAAISSPYISRVYHPAGFPDWMIKSDGWINAFETWTYVSATTFTISGDLTSKYQRGDKLKLTQTTVKYFDIADISYSGGSGLTTVTVNGHGLYSLANAAITDNFYSKFETPEGIPVWQDGWKVARETWTYASATTFTIGGDYTSVYQRGDKLKLTQTTAKYFDVADISYSAPNTTITVNGHGLYTLANAAITLNYFSNELNPESFPRWDDGWFPLPTCTYASETTFTISGDYSSILQKGQKIKLTQTTAKYFYVTSVSYSAPNTTITITGFADYTLANAAITQPYWSQSCNPYGFPSTFNMPTITYTTTGSAFTNAPTTNNALCWMEGDKFYFNLKFTSNATSGGTGTILATLTGLPAPVIVTAPCAGHIVTDFKALSVYYNSGSTRFGVSLYDGTTAIGNSKVYILSGFWPF